MTNNNIDEKLVEKYIKMYRSGEISCIKASEICNIPKTTFLLWARQDTFEKRQELVKVTRIRALRLELGMTAPDFASLIGICRATLYKWETLQRNLPIQKSVVICEKLGIDTAIDLQEVIEIPRRYLTTSCKSLDE